VRKPKKRMRKGGSKAKKPALQQTKSSRSASLQMRKHEKLIRVGKRVASWLIGSLAVAASIVGIWGPPWPTSPEFSPGAPSFALSLDVPFVVTNRSTIFGIHNLTIECHVISAHLKPSEKSLQNATIGIESNPYDPQHPLARNNVEANSASSYACPMTGGPIGGFGPTPEFPNDKLSEATIDFLTEYDSRWPWGGRTQSTSGVFTLNIRTNPPQWTQGVPLR
jgi:hypothetical protein